MALVNPSVTDEIVGIKFDKVADTDADYASAANNTIIYNLETKVVVLKDGNGVIRELYKNSLSESSIASAANIAANWDTDDLINVTALGVNTTIDNPTGTPKNGQAIVYQIEDDGTTRTIAVGGQFVTVDGVTTPTDTVPNKWVKLWCVWDAKNSQVSIEKVSNEA